MRIILKNSIAEYDRNNIKTEVIIKELFHFACFSKVLIVPLLNFRKKFSTVAYKRAAYKKCILTNS